METGVWWNSSFGLNYSLVMEYMDFVEQSILEFKQIQNLFLQKFKIEEYSNWFYDQTTEFLTLSLDDKEINFKYIPVGTFSSKTNTWMWAWENAHSIENSKLKTLQIKEFGIKYNFKKLKSGYFESDSNEGWKFVAIANQILNGIGGYRVNKDHLEKYIVIVGQVKNEVATKVKDETIYCESHGTRRFAFVCQHLNRETKIGFEEAFSTFKGMELEEGEDLQAWCNACEIERLKTNGWNEESTKLAEIKAICQDCYFEIKAHNLIIE